MAATTTGRVTVFSREGCVQCTATYRALDERGIDYRVVDVDELRESAADELRALGFVQLPVVQLDGQAPWSGFRPDRIADIHLDVAQSYRDGLFWTRCCCGQEFPGEDRDEADAAAFDHCFPEAVPT